MGRRRNDEENRMLERSRSLLLALLATGLGLGCASPGPDRDAFAPEEPIAEETTPLGGEGLALRRREMQRAYQYMGHFQTTLRGLDLREDRSGKVIFSQFLDAYMGLHLDPLLNTAWQSDHAELMALDAGLRLSKAELLIWMRLPGRAQRVIDELKKRFEGRETMLVDYPIGGQTTLGQAVEMLKLRKWRG